MHEVRHTMHDFVSPGLALIIILLFVLFQNLLIYLPRPVCIVDDYLLALTHRFRDGKRKKETKPENVGKAPTV